MSYLFRESRLWAGSWAEDLDFRDQSLGRREMLPWLETYHENSARCNGLQLTLLRYRLWLFWGLEPMNIWVVPKIRVPLWHS